MADVEVDGGGFAVCVLFEPGDSPAENSESALRFQAGVTLQDVYLE